MAPNVSFYRPVLNESIRLGKRWKQTDSLVAETAAKPTHKNEQCTKSNPTQIAAVVTQSQQCFGTTAMGTLGGWSHSPVKTLSDVLFRIKVDGANQLHRRFIRKPRPFVKSIFQR